MDFKILLCGDSAVSVVMGDSISLDVNRLVLRLQKSLEERPVKGVIEMIPSYASLMIQYDPMELSYEKLCEEIQAIQKTYRRSKAGRTGKGSPICYESDSGRIWKNARACRVQHGEVIRMHASHLYYVYMLGFAPAIRIPPALKNRLS